MLNRLAVPSILICLAGASAEAQTLSRTARTFVDVTVGPDWDDLYSTSRRAADTTWRVGFAWGFDWGTSGVEVGASVPGWHVKGDGPYQFRYVGPSFGWQRQGQAYESSSTVRRRSIDVTALYRGNVPLHRRVMFSWLAGAGYVYRPQQATYVTQEVASDGQRREVDVTSDSQSRNYPAAIGRVEVELRVAPRLSVVPRLRVTMFPSFIDDSGMAPRIVTARPEAAVRWQF